MKTIWYLAGPFFQYNEDVKALAKAAGVVIVDANVTADRSNAAEPDQLPTVTLKADVPTIAQMCDALLAMPASQPPPATTFLAAPAPTTVAAGVVDLGDGRTTTTAELEAKAIELSGLTPGKFKQLKKVEREGFVLKALAAAKG